MRPAFQTRQILLRSQQQVDTLLFLIPNLPLDADKPLEVIIREQVKQRGLSQNALYWMRLHEIAEQGWFQGRLYSADVWHDYCKKYVMPEEIITKAGEVRSKWVDAPDGNQAVISTAELNRGSFAVYTEMVEAFGAGLGVRFKEKGYE
jgi:hypothetical protein